MIDLDMTRTKLDNYMNAYLTSKEAMYSRRGGSEVIEAAKHAVLTGGHRWRPLITFGSAYLRNTILEHEVLPIAASIELIHASTLVLDDMPFFDNEKIRRGMETVHVKYHEDTAMLAQNGLLEWSTDLINENVEGEKKTKIFRVRSEAVDHLLAGQSLDSKILSGQPIGKIKQRFINSEQDAIRFYADKAGSLFVAAALAGAYLRGASESEITHLREFSNALGIAYQAIDDIKDKNKDIAVARRRLGGRKDAAIMTPASVLGIGGVRRIRKRYENIVDSLLESLSGDKGYLKAVVEEMRKESAKIH